MSTQVSLTPKPGFCVKTVVEQATILPSTSNPILVPQGCKIFVNIAWEKNVPPPPHADEEAIRNAMKGVGDWFVPVVVSDVREDLDKAGKRALVVDAVYNTTIKQRSIIDPDFKTFLIHIAFQRIEHQHSISLSANISTPNIASKGKLAPRLVLIPSSIYSGSTGQKTSIQRENLIEELPHNLGHVPSKGILKNTDAPKLNKQEKIPTWSWSHKDSSILLTISVPELERSQIHTSTLDIEAHRLILHIPSLYHLDIDTAQIRATNDDVQSEVQLSGLRDFDVENATAEWRVADGVILVYV